MNSLHTLFSTHRRMMLQAFGLLTILAVLAACGPQITTEKPWSEMNYNERLEFMGTKVFSPMKELFQTYDAKRFKNFSCKTCHGTDPDSIKYKMPNGIYPLNPKDTAKEDQAMVQFMKEKVMPELHKIMATSGYTKLACTSCHVKK